jgi:glycosyltransferase involved in cell wall biosynthesis
MKPLLSILICTIDGRESFLQSLLQNIENQIKGYEKEIEVVVCKDNKERTIGSKRNELLQGCIGEWACFIDDDDQIAEDYIPKAIKILKEENPDCINLIGVITTDGKIFSMGSNALGALMDLTIIDRTSPVKAKGIAGTGDFDLIQ